MESWTYAGMLLFVLVATLPLELVLHTRIYTRPLRLGLVLLCVAPPFILWDVLATRAGHWSFDLSRTWGATVGDLPVEELMFFFVVPVASVMTLEAVRAVRGWTVGDEPQEVERR
ncbi:lycopene cyclase domain-containing protein [Aeromicrobium sp. SMF47]|uniref:Lycopene cyclase domain-containing protein n=1 Tax=Aeromicrobium yanjiei TaxID=2662028 RepID=A0A5Q2ME78_9ACTN|nr:MULTISPECIES: lycopene cyclase domain-containing protein [Aeromicrobium]MRJ75419.1 lycopene cyclase domain-containing protein [Aeromicrobium yanjiei]MRK02524.1 lycopene cyclase domain-containing protein [Aeromicrobium sp. S22]QGG40133.1 lycopene cyclase domain-containing protein [Aeromicrobium yanjiei]